MIDRGEERGEFISQKLRPAQQSLEISRATPSCFLTEVDVSMLPKVAVIVPLSSFIRIACSGTYICSVALQTDSV